MDVDVQHYREQGYLLVKGLFESHEVEQMRHAIDSIVAAASGTSADSNHAWDGAGDGAAVVLKAFHDLQYHDACFTRAVVNPRMVAVLEQLIGPNVQLHHSKMLVKPPEQGAPFPMHQDYPYFPHSLHTPLAASVHLDDADEENGCLRVVPGTHLRGPLQAHGDSREVSRDEFPLESGVPCPAKAGDVLFFNYLTVHGSGINTSTRTRRNVLFQYRDPADAPVLDDAGREEHVDWGQGLMVAGSNRDYLQRAHRFQVAPAREPAAV